MLNILYNTKSPRCNSSKCFAYWDGKCSALVSSSFKGGCPFFKDKESKAAEDLRCKDRVPLMIGRTTQILSGRTSVMIIFLKAARHRKAG